MPLKERAAVLKNLDNFVVLISHMDYSESKCVSDKPSIR